jgi:hypothetical protein
MKTLILISTLTSILAIASFPLQENFNSFGGANEWSWFGDASSSGAASHNGHLCFNPYSRLRRGKVYGAISPYYGTMFADSLCNTIDLTFEVDMNIRSTDAFYLAEYDYLLGAWSYYLIPSSGTFNLNLNSETSQLAFMLITSSSSQSLSGKYVHVDYLTIECEAPIVFEADLLDVSCTTYDEYIEVDALFSDSTEIVFQTSNDGITWSDIATHNEYYATIEHKTANINNYYRVRYDDVKYSNTVHCRQTNIDVQELLIQEIKYFNTLGQEISERDTYNQVHVMTKLFSDGSVKSEVKPKQIH